MPVLEITNDSDFGCRFQGWPQSADEKFHWQQLVTSVVQYAFGSRLATVITVSPVQWSIGHFLPQPRSVRFGSNEYLLNRIDHCTDAQLAEIAESEDFQRGLLWISSVDDSDERLLEVASLIDITRSAQSSSYELLMLLDDARHLHWLHPGRDVNELETQLKDRASSLGWSISSLSETEQ